MEISLCYRIIFPPPTKTRMNTLLILCARVIARSALPRFPNVKTLHIPEELKGIVQEEINRLRRLLSNKYDNDGNFPHLPSRDVRKYKPLNTPKHWLIQVPPIARIQDDHITDISTFRIPNAALYNGRCEPPQRLWHEYERAQLIYNVVGAISVHQGTDDKSVDVNVVDIYNMQGYRHAIEYRGLMTIDGKLSVVMIDIEMDRRFTTGYEVSQPHWHVIYNMAHNPYTDLPPHIEWVPSHQRLGLDTFKYNPYI